MLQPGLDELTRRTGIPFAGVLPWLPDVWLDAEDTLEVAAWRHQGAAQAADSGSGGAAATAVERHRCRGAGGRAGGRGGRHDGRAAVAAADLAVLPGTRSTVSDLDWLRRTGLAQVIEARARRDAPVLGICGGYQMLARVINDPIESGHGVVEGLGLLPPRSACREKVLGAADRHLAWPPG